MQDVAKSDTSVMSKEAAYNFMREYYTVVKPRKDSIASVIMAKAAEMTDREAELAMAVAAAMQSGYELGRLSAQKDDNKASA